MEKDDLGDRMKAYEAAGDTRLDATSPIYARLDGRSFSRFTRGMERPFDPAMTEAMIATAAGLVEHTHAAIGYTQSDEISLVWLAASAESQVFFDGRVQKLASVLAGLGTALFTQAIMRGPLAERAATLPHFDCRVVGLPSREEAANMLLWRQLDARKNAVSTAARAHFSHKALHGKNRRQMLEMLALEGVDFEAFPSAFKRGTFVRRVTEFRPFTVAELERIPETFRPSPDELVERSEVRRLDVPHMLDMTDRVGFVFA
jgi:tRNA(His) 5'-end guanylyltransferase